MKLIFKTILLGRLLLVFLSANAQSSATSDSLLKIIPALNDTARYAALFEVGNAYYLKGMNDTALYYYSQSLENAKKFGKQKRVCEANLAMAKCYMHLQQYDEALELLFYSAGIAEKESFSGITANAKYLISYIYDFQGKSKEALQFASEAEKGFIKLADTAGLISLYPELVTSYGKNGDTVKALSYFRAGLEIFNRYEQSTSVSISEKEHFPLKRMALIFNAVNIMEQNSDLLTALYEVEKINDIVQAGDNAYEKFETNTLFAVINLKLKRFKQAQSYAEEAARLMSPESGNYDQLADVYHVISDASDSLGEYKKAYNALALYKQFNDSIFKIGSQEAIHSVEARYETKKKEQQIAVLNKEKRSQRVLVIISAAGLLVVLGLLLFAIRANNFQKKLFIKEKEVTKADIEKKMYELEQTALRAQMNPHFIFNCLNSVQRFVIGNDTEGLNHYLSTFATLIRQTLENSGKQLIPLKDEIRYLETYIKMEQLRSNNRFDYTIHVNQDLNESGIYIPNMIIQPFIENSIQHGLLNLKDKKGHIWLNISQSSKLICVVEDNGSGIKITTLLKLGSDEGHTSMGSVITEKRIQMYNSLHEEKIELDVQDKSETDNTETGTRVILKFPLSN